MYKSIFIIIIIIISILVLNLLTQNYTKDTIEILDKSLQDMREDFLKNEKDEDKLEKDIEDTFMQWDKRYEILAYYIEHDELEKIENDLTMVKSSVVAKEYEQGIEHIDTCIFLMKHIREKEAFNLKNIF